MKCLIALLQGPREVGTEMIGILNGVEVMLELARSESVDRQKIALECIIQARYTTVFKNAVKRRIAPLITL